MHSTEHQIDTEGIHFIVRVEQRFHVHSPASLRKCFISNDALAFLAQRCREQSEREDTFLAMQPTIFGVARRLAQAGVRGDPIQLGRSSFQ